MDGKGEVFSFLLPDADFSILLSEEEIDSLIAEAREIGITPMEHIIRTLVELYAAMESPEALCGEELPVLSSFARADITKIGPEELRAIIRELRRRQS